MSPAEATVSSVGSGAGAAFFDLDKTIIAKSALSAFRGPLYDSGLLTRRSVVRALLTKIIYMQLRGASEQRLGQVREALLRLSIGWNKNEVAEMVDQTLARTLEPIIYAEAMDLIEAHRSEGREVVIVSASPSEIVAPLGRHLGVESTISSEAATDEEDRYTGEMAFYCYGPYKAQALLEYCKKRSFDPADCYAYSDSYTDLPMLEAVGHPVAVNPDRVLARLARERNWEIRRFVRPVRVRDRVRGYVQHPYRRPVMALSAVLGMAGIGARWWIETRRATARSMTPVQKPKAPATR